MHKDLTAANAKRLDAEKRVAALEHEVRTLTDGAARSAHKGAELCGHIVRSVVRVRVCQVLGTG